MQIEELKRFAKYLSGTFIDRVVKESWPEETGGTLTSLVWSHRTGEVPKGSFKHSTRTYRIQQSAIESGHLPETASIEEVNQCTTALLENVRVCWEAKFAHEIMKATERRVVIKEDDQENFLQLCTTPILLEFTPRTSLLGKKIARHKVENGCLLLNPKYDRCPYQVLDFHKDAVHFLFPVLDEWAGEFMFHEIPEWQGETNDPPYVGRRFFRVIMSVAAKPVQPELSGLITVIPNGIRGWLYRTVWNLLRIKP